MKKICMALFLICLCAIFCACSTKPSEPDGSDVSTAGSAFPDTVANEAESVVKPEHVILLEGTHATEQYTITADEEGCFVTFLEEYVATKDELNACMSGEIHFDSLADMVASFQNNVFESSERITIQAAFPKSEKGTKICDLNRLYDAIKPAETMVTKISLSGQYYDFVITQEGLFASGWIVYTSETGWQKDRERTYAWTNGATITRDEESTFDGVPCRIVEYRNTTETYRDILIETEQDGKKVDMVLRYLLEDKRACPERVSDSAPWQLRIFGEDNGVFYEVVIGNMLDTPTYKWLSSFGLTPYVPASGDLATE